MLTIRNMTRFEDWQCQCGAQVKANESHGVEQNCQQPGPKITPVTYTTRWTPDEREQEAEALLVEFMTALEFIKLLAPQMPIERRDKFTETLARVMRWLYPWLQDKDV